MVTVTSSPWKKVIMDMRRVCRVGASIDKETVSPGTTTLPPLSWRRPPGPGGAIGEVLIKLMTAPAVGKVYWCRKVRRELRYFSVSSLSFSAILFLKKPPGNGLL